jgi:hypothetical protein
VLAVFDIDGVVADVRHRLHYLGRPHQWSKFFRAARHDTLLPEGAALVADLAREHDIVWLTGRPDWLRRTTLDWFARYELPGTELHMRPDGDYRPARAFKLGVLRRLAPRGIAAFVDDDREVVDAALAAGYPAALADWVPREDPRAADLFDALHDAQEHEGRT